MHITVTYTNDFEQNLNQRFDKIKFGTHFMVLGLTTAGITKVPKIINGCSLTIFLHFY